MPLKYLSSNNTQARAILTLFLSLALVLIQSSCTLSSEDLEYRRAEEASHLGKNADALSHYRIVVEKYQKDPVAIRSAQAAARISHYELKRFTDAIYFYRHIILYAPNEADRVDAQKKIAELYFSQTLDYTQAIIEYSRLLELPHTSKEDEAYRFAIARSYFYLNNFFQANVEIDRILASRPSDDLAFDALLLKSNIYLTMKKLDDAIVSLKELIAKYPVRSKNETIGLVLAICYEEQKNFGKAVETLEAIKSDYPRKGFIEGKIKALKERQSLLPGAKGLHK